VSHRRWRRGASHQGTGRYSPSAHLRPCSQHRFRVRGCRKPWAPTVRQTSAELQAMDSRGTERAFSLTLPEVAPRSSWMPDGSSWTWSSHGLRSLHSGALWRSPRQARHRSAPRISLHLAAVAATSMSFAKQSVASCISGKYAEGAGWPISRSCRPIALLVGGTLSLALPSQGERGIGGWPRAPVPFTEP
jgi:hypothetical protein